MPDAQTDDWQQVNAGHAAAAATEDWQPVGPKTYPFVPGMEGTTAVNPSVAAQWTAKELQSKDNPFIKYPLVAAGTLQTFVTGAVKQVQDAFITTHDVMTGQPVSLEQEISAGMVAAGFSRAPEGLGVKVAPDVVKANAAVVDEFRQTVTNPIIQSKIDEVVSKPNPLQALYDHLSSIDEAKQLGIIGEGRPEPTFNETPMQMAEQAVPRPLSAMATPEDMRGGYGHAPGSYDKRGAERIAKIDAPEDVMDAIKGIASKNDYFPESRAGTPSPAARSAVAEAAGIDPKDVAVTFDNDGAVRDTIFALREATRQFSEASQKLAAEPSDANAAGAAEAQLRATHVLEYVMGKSAESGRSLNAWKEMYREKERAQASIKLTQTEQAGETPRGASDLINAAGEVQTNLKTPGAKIGLQKLVDSAQGLVGAEKEAKATPAELSPELGSLVDEASQTLKMLKTGGEKTPAQFQRLIDTATKLVDATKKAQTPRTPLSPELQGLIDEAGNALTTLRQGGEKTPAQFQKLINAAENLVGAAKKPPKERAPLSPELEGLVGEAKNTLKRFGADDEAEVENFRQELSKLAEGNGKLGDTVDAARALLEKKAKAAAERPEAPKVASARGKLMGAAKRLVAAVDKTPAEVKEPVSTEMQSMMEAARQAVGRLKGGHLREEFDAFRNALNEKDAVAAKAAAQNLIDAEAKPLAEGQPKPPVEYDQAMAAARRVAKAGEETATAVKPTLPKDLADLIAEAKNAAGELGGERKSEMARLIDAAEKQAINMTKQKMVKNPVEALPPELQALVDKSERVVDRFGGIAKDQKAALLLARTGRTPAEQEWLAKSVSNLTPNQVANVLAKLRTSPLAKQEGWPFWLWEQGLISGWNTHTKYVGVNTGTLASERVLAPEMASVIGKLRGENTSLVAPIYGGISMVKSIPRAFTKAVEAFKTGARVPLDTEMRLFERGEESPQSSGAGAAYVKGPSPDWGIWRKVFNEDQLDVAGKVLGIPGRNANLIHTFFKFLAQEASMSMRAYDAAFKEGVTGDKFWERYQYHRDYPTDDALRGGTTDAYTGSYMNKLGEQSAKASAFLKNNPYTKWVFPFQHIPWNIERMTYMYSPAAGLDAITGWTTTGKALRGELGAPAQNLALARVTIGTTIAGYLMSKGINGEATGDYPIDPTERRRWAMLHIQPNSVRFGDSWYSMTRFAQFGNLARMGANLGEIYKNYNGQDDNAMLKAIGALGLAIVNQFADETGFETARNFIDVVDGKQSASRFLSWQAGSFLPMSSLLSQTASFMDPDMRIADGFIQGLRYRIPILREGLLPKRDPIFGEPLQNPGYHTIVRENTETPNPLTQELDRIKYYPTAPRKTIGGVRLTDEQYDKYEATAGPLVKEVLRETFNSPGYRDSDVATQKIMAKGAITQARAEARDALQSYFDKELIHKPVENATAAISGG